MANPTDQPWLRFSIRTLLIAITLFGCGLGWVVNERSKIKRAFAAIERRGGKADVGEGSDLAATWVRTGMIKKTRPAIASFLFGEIWPSDIEQIDFGLDSHFADGDMPALVAFPNLKSVDLGQTKVTGRGLVDLHQLRHLRVVYFNDAPLTDEGLKHLNRLPIVHLDLSGTKISDDGLAQLNNLPKLRSLYLNDTQISDAGIIQLQQIKSLESVWTFQTKVTQSGKEALRKKLPNCDI